MTAGVFLVLSAFLASAVEGVEALTIVLASGVARGWRSSLTGVGAAVLPLAALGAGVAVVLVPVLGFAVRAPLARVPENTLKFAVGVMLTTFGIFWSTEGAGGDWPGSDAALFAILGFVIAMSFALVAVLRRRKRTMLGTAGAHT